MWHRVQYTVFKIWDSRLGGRSCLVGCLVFAVLPRIREYQVGRGTLRIIWSSLRGKSMVTITSSLSRWILKESNTGKSTTSQGWLFQELIVLPMTDVPLLFNGIFPGVIYTHYPLSFPCDSLWKGCLLLCSPPWWELPQTSFSQGWTSLVPVCLPWSLWLLLRAVSILCRCSCICPGPLPAAPCWLSIVPGVLRVSLCPVQQRPIFEENTSFSFSVGMPVCGLSVCIVIVK